MLTCPPILHEHPIKDQVEHYDQVSTNLRRYHENDKNDQKLKLPYGHQTGEISKYHEKVGKPVKPVKPRKTM